MHSKQARRSSLHHYIWLAFVLYLLPFTADPAVDGASWSDGVGGKSMPPSAPPLDDETLAAHLSAIERQLVAAEQQQHHKSFAVLWPRDVRARPAAAMRAMPRAWTRAALEAEAAAGTGIRKSRMTYTCIARASPRRCGIALPTGDLAAGDDAASNPYRRHQVVAASKLGLSTMHSGRP